MSCYSFAESLARSAQKIRLALVLPTDDKSKNDVIFTSTVMANRGASSREFESIDEAKKWLLKRK
jgi:hypothetical protein